MSYYNVIIKITKKGEIMKEQFLLRMPKNIKEKLKQYGNEKGLSINAIILTAIYEYLERKVKKEDRNERIKNI